MFPRSVSPSRVAWLFVAIGTLSGCATPSSRDGNSAPSVATSAARHSPRAAFTMGGRFSAQGENKRERASGQFRYAETREQRTLSLFTPFGSAVAEVIANATGVTLTDAQGAQRHAATVSDLLRDLFALPLPDAVLSAWLQGLPASGDEARDIEFDGNGWPRRFVQSGWLVDIGERRVSDGVPQRMRWSLVASATVEIRWLIDDWSAP